MYNNSTHKEFWTFRSSVELNNLLNKTNRNYRVNYCNKREGLSKFIEIINFS